MSPEYTPDFIAHFWSRVDMRGGRRACWIWQGSKDTTGYGQVGLDGRLHRAHRVAYELINGPIPDGLCLLHSCDVRDCVNPRHLTPGTYADNNHDAIRKGRNVVLRGDRNGRSKLTAEQIAEIRRRRADGEQGRALAREFGVSDGLISHIVSGLAWKHLP